MKVLIACEESQRVCIAFRQRGHEAFSCDIVEPSGGHPEWHIQDNVLRHLDGWDLIIAHPPCTYLSVSGNQCFSEKIYSKEQIQYRIEQREKAVDFFKSIYNANCGRIAIENPVGYMNTHFRKPDQIIHPYYFGDPYEKKTCLWLKNLPKLVPTNIVVPEPRHYFASGKSFPAWYYESSRYPIKDRSKLRSKTFPGIAKAMAEQWGN